MSQEKLRTVLLRKEMDCLRAGVQKRVPGNRQILKSVEKGKLQQSGVKERLIKRL